MKLSNLVSLDVSFNIIEKVVNSALVSLKVLNASNNQLSSLVLNDCKELEQLNLSNNQFTSIFPLKSFEELPKLHTLDVSYNKIKWVKLEETSVAEATLKELKKVDLSNNLIDN